jgi:hypothetical protein
MRASRLAVLLLLATATAHAGPAVRYGVTFAVEDQGAPLQHQFGPMLGLGVPLGPFTAEVDYAYLSFMEPDVLDGGMHRLGANVRAQLFRSSRTTRFYAQAGAAMRYGRWHLDAKTVAPAHSDRQREAHLGLGLELVNQFGKTRYGWMFGLRLAAAPRDDLMLACRGSGCSSTDDRGGETDLALLIEWTFVALP